MKYKKAFVLRLGHQGDNYRVGNYISIGWSQVKGLAGETDWGNFRELIRGTYPDYTSEHALGNAAGSLWRFFREMDSDSIILIPRPNGEFDAGELVDNAPIYDQESVDDDTAHRRNVRWILDTPRKRSYASDRLQRRLKARQTCVTASDLLEDIEDALNRRDPIDIVTELVSQLGSGVASTIEKYVNDIGLEDIVLNLCQAQGAKATKLARNIGLQGDIDVLAEYPIIGGPNGPTAKIGYQVKKHDHETDDYAVRQVIERMEAMENDVHFGVVVSTASQFTPSAKALAEKNNISLIGMVELSEWILSTGIQSLKGTMPNE